MPERPLIFLKPPSAVIRNGEAIILPQVSRRIEHEGEIGVVIGERARNVPEEAALSVIGGFVPLNDVTARDLQKLDIQFTRAKGFDTFCPIGSLVPASEVDQWQELEVICRVNGSVRQHGHARDMAFGIPALISFISAVMTLEAGDVIATGTPAGVGPLQPGDVVEVEIPGLVSVVNPVMAPQDED